MLLREIQAGPRDEQKLSGIFSNPMTPAVLLIDDNAVQAVTRQTILRRAGYFVLAVLNPRRALEQLKSGEFPVEIGLIITDHLMPEMSGAAFVHELRETHGKLPVMVISGLEEAEAEYAGMNVLFRLKPLLPDKLLASVESLLKVAEAKKSLTGGAVADGR
jgi:CheY-like chemotaxis protein